MVLSRHFTTVFADTYTRALALLTHEHGEEALGYTSSDMYDIGGNRMQLCRKSSKTDYREQLAVQYKEKSLEDYNNNSVMNSEVRVVSKWDNEAIADASSDK